MLTHVHKVIHLVVGTFEQEWWSLVKFGVEEALFLVTGCRTGRWTCASGHHETWADSEEASDRTLAKYCSASGHAGVVCSWGDWEDRTLADVRSWASGSVWSSLDNSGSSLDSIWRWGAERSCVSSQGLTLVHARGRSDAIDPSGPCDRTSGLTLTRAGKWPLQIGGRRWTRRPHGLHPATGRWPGSVRSCWPARSVSTRQAAPRAQQLYWFGGSIKGVWPALAHSLGHLHWHSNLISLAKALSLISIIDSSSLWDCKRSKCIAWVFVSRATWCSCFAAGFACYSWWLPPPRWLGAVRIIEQRWVIVSGSDRGDCEGFLTFSRRRAKRYSSVLLVACVILILCWLCGTLSRV
jgi:hypothetical protein